MANPTNNVASTNRKLFTGGFWRRVPAAILVFGLMMWLLPIMGDDLAYKKLEYGSLYGVFGISLGLLAGAALVIADIVWPDEGDHKWRRIVIIVGILLVITAVVIICVIAFTGDIVAWWTTGWPGLLMAIGLVTAVAFTGVDIIGYWLEKLDR